MPFPFLGAALAGASFLLRPHGQRPNISGAIRRYENAGPNAGDYAFGERQLGRTNEVIGQGLSEARAGVSRRFRARGLAGPAEDQALGNIEQAGALAKVSAGRDTADMIDARSRSRAANIFNAEVGQAGRDQASYDSQQSGFWNSMIDLLPNLVGAGNKALGDVKTGGIVDSPLPGALPRGNFG